MNNKNKRVLWLLNHNTLMDIEPQLLENLGFEVYIPKLLYHNVAHRSTKITYEFDARLTIPKADLDSLNKFNFYRTAITPKIRRILNRYFSIMIVPAYPEMLSEAIENFEGQIILRAFGLTVEPVGSYGKYFELVLGERFRDAIEKLGSRFHFGLDIS